jgi:hypothetical protein
MYGWAAELTLCSGTDNNLIHINIGRLLDRERNSAYDRLPRHANLSRDSTSWVFTSGFVTASAKFVWTKAGEK